MLLKGFFWNNTYQQVRAIHEDQYTALPKDAADVLDIDGTNRYACKFMTSLNRGYLYSMPALKDDSLLVFSIIIPTYNYSMTLGRAIDSVLEQGGDDYQVVIIDDGSTDDTSSVAASYCRRFPEKISYHLQENQGPAAARNNGVTASRGEYIFFLDADDEMALGILEILRQRVQRAGNVDLIIGDHISVNTDGRTSYSTTNTLPETREQRFLAYLTKKLNLAHCAKLVHRSVFDRVSYPVDLRSSEDIPFVAHVLALYDCELMNVPMAVMHKHDDSLRHNTAYTRLVGEKVVDCIFSYDLLPDWAAKYERIYRARRCLSVFRTLYLSGNTREGLPFYKKALLLSPFLALRFSYIKKVIGAWVSG